MRWLRYPVATITLLALVLRLAYCVVIVFVAGKAAPGGTAHDGYLEIARSLVSGGGYRLLDEPNFFRPPTYVLFLVPWVALPGTHFWILFSQSVMTKRATVRTLFASCLLRQDVQSRSATQAGPSNTAPG